MRNPVPVLAHAIAAFQAELSMADGPAYEGPFSPDERLGALICRVVARLGEEERNSSSNSYELRETTALDDFIETLESASNAVLDPITGVTPVPDDTSNNEGVGQ